MRTEAGLTRSPDDWGTRLVALACAASVSAHAALVPAHRQREPWLVMLAYLASRTARIPVLAPALEDVDAAGVATTSVEAIGLARALWLLQPGGRPGRPTHLKEVSQ